MGFNLAFKGLKVKNEFKKKLFWYIQELIFPENVACFELLPNQNLSVVNVNYEWHLTCFVNSTSDSIQYVERVRDCQ
jgi:hypothetical protein